MENINNSSTNLPEVYSQLQAEEDEITSQVLTQQDGQGLKDLTILFNAVQTKKNALRVQKLNGLFDKVIGSITERFDRRIDEFSNRDLLDYLTAIQTATEKAQKGLNTVAESPPIIFQQNNNNQQVNIKVEDTLSRESREKIMDVITSILQKDPVSTTEFMQLEDISDVSEADDDEE